MTRSRALLAIASLVVAAGLTLGAAGMLGLIELPVRDGPLLAWLKPERPETDPDRAAGAGHVPSLDPAPRTDPGPAPGPAPAPTVRRAAPVSLRIDALDVSAPIEQVGVLPDGAMEIPDDVATVGWYATEHRRISPGEPGTAVIAGHRDSRRQGAGALHDLSLLEPGDTIHVVHLDGRTSVWSVDRVLTTPRDALPSRLLFARDGDPLLAVVTCGGTFDRATRTYSHNTIVIATPAPRYGIAGGPATYARSR